eukprot:Hpha_TRINITY_DN1876_c0_g1::TRINITY_DN1876_c0_g1_i1::g.170598::m.170598
MLGNLLLSPSHADPAVSQPSSRAFLVSPYRVATTAVDTSRPPAADTSRRHTPGARAAAPVQSAAQQRAPVPAADSRREGDYRQQPPLPATAPAAQGQLRDGKRGSAKRDGGAAEKPSGATTGEDGGMSRTEVFLTLSRYRSDAANAKRRLLWCRERAAAAQGKLIRRLRLRARWDAWRRWQRSREEQRRFKELSVNRALRQSQRAGMSQAAEKTDAEVSRLRKQLSASQCRVAALRSEVERLWRERSSAPPVEAAPCTPAVEGRFAGSHRHVPVSPVETSPGPPEWRHEPAVPAAAKLREEARPTTPVTARPSLSTPLRATGQRSVVREGASPVTTVGGRSGQSRPKTPPSSGPVLRKGVEASRQPRNTPREGKQADRASIQKRLSQRNPPKPDRRDGEPRRAKVVTPLSSEKRVAEEPAFGRAEASMLLDAPPPTLLRSSSREEELILMHTIPLGSLDAPANTTMESRERVDDPLQRLPSVEVAGGAKLSPRERSRPVPLQITITQSSNTIQSTQSIPQVDSPLSQEGMSSASPSNFMPPSGGRPPRPPSQDQQPVQDSADTVTWTDNDGDKVKLKAHPGYATMQYSVNGQERPPTGVLLYDNGILSFLDIGREVSIPQEEQERVLPALKLLSESCGVGHNLP